MYSFVIENIFFLNFSSKNKMENYYLKRKKMRIIWNFDKNALQIFEATLPGKWAHEYILALVVCYVHIFHLALYIDIHIYIYRYIGTLELNLTNSNKHFAKTHLQISKDEEHRSFLQPNPRLFSMVYPYRSKFDSTKP